MPSKKPKKTKKDWHPCEGCPHFGGAEKENPRKVSCCGDVSFKGQYRVRLAPGLLGRTCPDRPGAKSAVQEGSWIHP